MKGFIFIVLGTTLVLSAAQNAIATDQEAIEEVVVTGSYLKRNAADSPSPLSVITSADIEDLGVADIAEIIQTMPWQSGSQARANTFGGEGADGRNTINLRNLGHGATLVLVNGKRNVPSWYNPRGNASVNINALIPTIALERLEIIKDGASALYGSDAIAGVANFITKKDFEGMDITYQLTTDDETTKGDAYQGEIIFGLQGDRGGIVVAASFLNRDEVTIGDLFERHSGSSVSSTGQPGRFDPLSGEALIWAANGVDPGNPVLGASGSLSTILPRDAQGLRPFGNADVDCENSAALDPNAGPIGVVFTNICAFDFGSFFALQAEESLRKVHVTGHYDITDDFEVYYEFGSANSEFDRDNSLNPNALNVTIPVTNFGNVEDAFRRGIEPIQLSNRTRLIGGTARDAGGVDRPIKTFTDTSRSDERLVGGIKYDFQLGNKDWTIDASYTVSESDDSTTQVQDTRSTEMNLAINGLGGPNCDTINGTPGEGNLAFAAAGGDFNAGNCFFFNPFGSHRFARDGSRQTDLTLINPAELYEWLLGRVTSDSEFRQQVVDIVVAGDLFETRSGPIGLAIGGQRRRDTASFRFDATTNANNLDFAFGAQDWDGELTTLAAFFELAVPFDTAIGDFDINFALRFEDFDEIDTDTTDPKISVMWRINDSWTVRASAGDSFRVPSLQQLFGSITTVANETDVDGDSAFRPSISTGNESLQPEESSNFNIGVSWVPQQGGFLGFLDGFQIDLDYYDYEYEDIITRQQTRTLLSEDNAALQAAMAGGMTLIEAVNAGIGNRDQIIRNGQGLFLRAEPDFENANSADIEGLDLSASYSFDTAWGAWRVGLQMAWLKTYDVVVTSTNGSIVKFDAVGEFNQNNPVARPLPEYKTNMTLNWSLNRHRVFVLVQFVDDVNFGDPSLDGASNFWRETIRVKLGQSASDKFFTSTIDSQTTADIQYTYSFGETGVFSDSNIVLGVKNFTDEKPPWAPVNTGFEGTLHSPLGRIWFVKVGASL